MRIIIIATLVFLSGCSGYTVVSSLSTNLVTVATTGKTNADFVISKLVGKDCKFFRVTINREICKQHDSNIALKEVAIEKNNKKDKKIVGRIIDTTFYITKNVAKDHAVLGAKIFDRVGLTNELEEKVKTKFEITKIEKNLSQKPKNNIKEKTSNLKKENNNAKSGEITWRQRVAKVKIQKNELVEEVKTQKNELVEEVKTQKNELVKEVKIKSKTIIEAAKVQKNELVEDAKVKSKTIIEAVKVQKNELVEDAKVKSIEVKENFLKKMQKFKLYGSNTYVLNVDK